MKTLVLPLRRHWFELIKSGRKSHEYRLRNAYWIKRLEGKQFDTVVFTLGYPKKTDFARRIEVPYRGFTILTVTSAEWGNEPREVFAIPTS